MSSEETAGIRSALRGPSVRDPAEGGHRHAGPAAPRSAATLNCLTALVSAAILLLAFALRLHGSMVLGVQADEGVHLTAAERVAAGEVLYRDLYEDRTPGVEWLLSLVIRAGGPALVWGRWLSSVMGALTAAALVSSGRTVMLNLNRRRTWAGEGAGWAAALLFGLAPLPIFWSRFVMLEPFSTAAAACCIAAALQGAAGRRPRWWLASGLCAGASILFKQSAMVLAPAFALFVGLLALARGRREGGRAAALWSAGLALPLAALAVLLMRQGAESHFLHFLAGMGRLDPLLNWSEKWAAVRAWAPARPLVALAILGWLVALTSRRLLLALPLLWFTLEMGALWLPPELDLSWGGLSHYALPATAAGALLAGCGLAWAWQSSRARPRRRLLLAGATLLLAAASLPGWWSDLVYVVQQSDYPQPDRAQEARIGRAAAAATPGEEPIVVLANAAFYHWAGRRPAARFYHYPGSLPDSRAAAEAEADVQRALADAGTGAVLVSRLHLDRRLPPALVAALWQKWEPVALFEYPYQQDVLLFLPRLEPPAGHPALATLGSEIELVALSRRPLGPDSLLVGLVWRARSRPAADYTAFVHLLGPDGALVAQHDGVPVIGFRPTTTWSGGEAILDWHWVDLPAGAETEGALLSVGLYRADNGERLPMLLPGQATPGDAFTVPLAAEEEQR